MFSAVTLIRKIKLYLVGFHPELHISTFLFSVSPQTQDIFYQEISNTTLPSARWGSDTSVQEMNELRQVLILIVTKSQVKTSPLDFLGCVRARRGILWVHPTAWAGWKVLTAIHGQLLPSSPSWRGRDGHRRKPQGERQLLSRWRENAALKRACSLGAGFPLSLSSLLSALFSPLYSLSSLFPTLQ